MEELKPFKNIVPNHAVVSEELPGLRVLNALFSSLGLKIFYVTPTQHTDGS